MVKGFDEDRMRSINMDRSNIPILSGMINGDIRAVNNNDLGCIIGDNNIPFVLIEMDRIAVD
jgi:hypothetical protein